MSGQGRPLSWMDVLGLSLTLAEEIRRSKPDVVVAVMRGGIYPALVITSRLGVERLYVLEYRKYSDEKPPRELWSRPRLLRDEVPELGGESILIVDDVARTGSTLKAAKDLVESRGAGEVRSAVLVIRSRDMVYAPDYYAVYMRACPIFPWERR